MGLLAKATAILEQEQKAAIDAAQTNEVSISQAETQAVANAAATVDNHRRLVKQGRFKKLKRLVSAFTVGLAMAQTLPNVPCIKNTPTKLEMHLDDAAMQKCIDNYARTLGGVTNHERNLLAKMLYGEAGLGTDPFEVLHTVLNRAASPLFKGSITDLVTQPGQYIGYKDSNPVTPAFRHMVDIAVDDWEKHGKQTVDGCNHYYFVTGTPNVCNKFEISQDAHGKWVAPRHKQYEKLRHYCPVAEQQAARYYQQYGHGNPRTR